MRVRPPQADPATVRDPGRRGAEARRDRRRHDSRSQPGAPAEHQGHRAQVARAAGSRVSRRSRVPAGDRHRQPHRGLGRDRARNRLLSLRGLDPVRPRQRAVELLRPHALRGARAEPARPVRDALPRPQAGQQCLPERLGTGREDERHAALLELPAPAGLQRTAARDCARGHDFPRASRRAEFLDRGRRDRRPRPVLARVPAPPRRAEAHSGVVQRTDARGGRPILVPVQRGGVGPRRADRRRAMPWANSASSSAARARG